MSQITKENMNLIAARLQAFGQKIQPGLEIQVDTELDQKMGLYSIYLYFKDPVQDEAIKKALAAIQKQVKAGTLGDEEEPAAKPVKATTATAPTGGKVAASIVKELADYSVTVTAAQVQEAIDGKVNAAFEKKVSKLIANPPLLALAAKKKVPLIFVLLCVLSGFVTKDKALLAGMENARKKLPALVAEEEEEVDAEADEEEDEEADEEEEEADDDFEEEEEEEEVVVKPAKNRK